MDACNLPETRCGHHQGDSLRSSKRTISVMATGVALGAPNVFTFDVTISSTKPVLDEARTSVKRRGDYILQVRDSVTFHHRYSHGKIIQ